MPTNHQLCFNVVFAVHSTCLASFLSAPLLSTTLVQEVVHDGCHRDKDCRSGLLGATTSERLDRHLHGWLSLLPAVLAIAVRVHSVDVSLHAVWAGRIAGGASASSGCHSCGDRFGRESGHRAFFEVVVG